MELQWKKMYNVFMNAQPHFTMRNNKSLLLKVVYLADDRFGFQQ